MRNSFLELRDLEMTEFREHRQDAVRQRVEKQLRTSAFISDTLELFFPKLADTLTVMMGGEAIEGLDDYRTVDDDGLLPSEDRSEPSGPSLPEGQSGVIR